MSLTDKICGFFGKAEKETKVLKGKETKDKFFSSEKSFESEILTKEAFTKAKARLFDVNRWSSIPNPLSANFKLHNASGIPKDDPQPILGDFMEIDLPGPLPMYWVEVVHLKEGEDLAEFTVRPSEDPRAVGPEAEKTKHFFQQQATSTFRVRRNANSIAAFEIGKDESPNVKSHEAGSLAPVNALVAETGWAGFQKIQWQSLCDYIVGK